jgi:TRAP-type C4-dicarboxylate transport system permease small subunit
LKEKITLKWATFHIPEIIAGSALIVALIVTSTNAFSRYLFRRTFAGYDEITCFMFAWAVFPGAAAAFRRKLHYGIDLIVILMPERVRAVVQIITSILITIIVGILTYLSIVLMTGTEGKLFSVSKLSYASFDAALVVGFGFMTIYSTVFTVKLIKEFMASEQNGKQGGL